ncbi:hypothetical protein Tco_0296510 [Tanacetum coccineum]
MADNRTMAQMLQAPIEGYEDAIVVPPINANNFELKQTLINLVQNGAKPEIETPITNRIFYNSLNSNDQDALDFCSGGQFLGQNASRRFSDLSNAKSNVRSSEVVA